MKNSRLNFVIALFFVLLSAGNARSQGIEFFEGSFEEAKELAIQQGKMIFIDAYAVWCGPCKRMSNVVFPNEEVGELYNKFFINMKIDMEKPPGKEFAKTHPVSAYPTLFYLKPDGSLIERVTGGRSVEDFLALGKKITGSFTVGPDYNKMYEEGDKSPETIFNYIIQLNQLNKNAAPVVNEFIKTNPDMSKAENRKVVFAGTTEADSKVFNLFVRYQKELEGQFGKEEVEDKILAACMKTAIKAGEYEYESLLEEAKEKVKKHVPGESKRFNLEADLVYATAMKDPILFMKSTKDIEKVFGKDADKLFAFAALAENNFSENMQIISAALEWSAKSVALQNTSKHRFLKALLHEKKGEIALAREEAEKALEIVKQSNENPTAIQQFLNRLPKK
jgi:thioredoxin-related protein